jgi:hypothetical protein
MRKTVLVWRSEHAGRFVVRQDGEPGQLVDAVHAMRVLRLIRTRHPTVSIFASPQIRAELQIDMSEAWTEAAG